MAPDVIEATPFEWDSTGLPREEPWMLVLSRKINETIVIGGNIRVTMTAIRNRQVRLAIDAPPDVPIVRQELLLTPPEREPDRGRAPEPSGRARRDNARRTRDVRTCQ
jgi:carbon storage regulator